MHRRVMAYAADQLGHPRGLGGWALVPLLNWQNRRWMDASVDLLAPAAGDRVADIGFGGGYALRVLLERTTPDGHVVGIDPSRTAARVARHRYWRAITAGRLTIAEGDMQSLEAVVGAEKLSGAISVNTIYYIPELTESLLRLRGALMPGGRIVLGLGDPSYMAELPFADGLILRPLAAVTEQLARSGFKVTDHTRTSDDPRAFHLLGCTVAGAS